MDISVVIPSYKQAATICREIRALDSLLQSIVRKYEIILVIDGDEDDTYRRVMKELDITALRVERFAHNRGKGAALRHGMLEAQGELVAFIDAGGDIDPSYLELMIEMMKFYGVDVVIGSKRHRFSRVSYPLIRRIYSRIYQEMNRMLFNLGVRDTQVGLKLFKRAVVQKVVPEVFTQKFAFDLELLIRTRHHGFTIIESPVSIAHTFHSSINVRAAARIVWDTMQLFFKITLTAPSHKKKLHNAHFVTKTTNASSTVR